MEMNDDEPVTMSAHKGTKTHPDKEISLRHGALQCTTDPWQHATEIYGQGD